MQSICTNVLQQNNRNVFSFKYLQINFLSKYHYMIKKIYQQWILSFRKNRTHLEAEVKESKIVRSNKNRRCMWEMKDTDFWQHSPVWMQWWSFPPQHFNHVLLFMNNYSISFCQAVLFSITAVSHRDFMIICKISCVWKEVVCSEFIYWKVVARLCFWM